MRCRERNCLLRLRLALLSLTQRGAPACCIPIHSLSIGNMLRNRFPTVRRAAEAAVPAASLLQSLRQLLASQEIILQQSPSADVAAPVARQYGSAARHQARPATAAGPVGGAGFPTYLAEDEEPEPELRLPDDLSTIATLHPQLREIMLQHQSLQT